MGLGATSSTYILAPAVCHRQVQDLADYTWLLMLNVKTRLFPLFFPELKHFHHLSSLRRCSSVHEPLKMQYSVRQDLFIGFNMHIRMQ
jgi:hypothetical protein